MKFKIPAIFLLVLAFSGIYSVSRGQSHLPNIDSIKRNHISMHWFDIGAGFGMDYGGVIGAQFMVHPATGYCGVFLAGGYDILNLAWGAGIEGQYPAADNIHKVRGKIKLMYGPSAVIKVEGASEYNKIYYGLIPGIGLQLRFGRERTDGLDLDLNFPLRPADFFSQLSEIKNNPSIDLKNDIWPVAFSIGFHHEF